WGFFNSPTVTHFSYRSRPIFAAMAEWVTTPTKIRAVGIELYRLSISFQGKYLQAAYGVNIRSF
ncbi:MAG: hypothetical protein ACO3BO_00740, partial [Anaerohalosphaeraceae bacterium]